VTTETNRSAAIIHKLLENIHGGGWNRCADAQFLQFTAANLVHEVKKKES
jgi:hypothetical protein